MPRHFLSILDFTVGELHDTLALARRVKAERALGPQAPTATALAGRHLGLPFAVGAQAQRVPEGVEPMPEEEFFETLRYVHARGGRIFMQDAEAMAASKKFREAGLEPVGIANAVSPDPAAIQIGRIFIQRVPGSDPVPFFLHTPLRLAKGGWLWPANVRGGLDGEHLDTVRSQVRRIVAFRGGVAGVVVPAWLPFQSMRDLVDAGRSTGVPVVDPLESVPKTF